jgi:LPXTG-motif cell wall-anchored protein
MIARTLGLLVIGAVLFVAAGPASASVSEPRTVDAGIFPDRVAVTPDGAQAWILATTSRELIGYTTGATLTNIASWPLPGTDYDNANVAILPDGKRAIVTDASGEQVNIVDLTTGVITNPPELNGPEPTDVALSPDGSKVAIAYVGGPDPFVSVFNTSDWSFLAGLDYAIEFTSLAFSPDGSYFAAASSEESRVYVTDIATESSVIINAPDTPSTIAYSSDGESIFVGSFGGASIRKFEAITGMELLSLSTPNTGYLAVSPDGTQLWASQPVAAQVGVYNTSNLSLVEEIPISANASGISFAQFGCQAWVVRQFAGTADVYDLDPCLPGPAPTPALPDTGASPSIVGTSVAVSAGLLAAGAIALFVVRRRNTVHTQ